MTDTFRNASAAWSRLATYRAERARCKRYVYGEQWEDLIDTTYGRMTEREFIRRQGQEPLKNNILRRILRNVVGLYREQYKVPQVSFRECGLSGKKLKMANRRIRQWFHENSMEELASRLFEEFLISGLTAVKIDGKRILPVTPDNLFFHSDGSDPRGGDVDLIGEIHRVAYGTLMERFCETADDYHRLREIYGQASQRIDGCRIMETWQRETRLFALLHDEDKATLRIADLSASPLSASDLSAKVMTRTGWRRRWYAPDGTMLREDDLMEEHPYVVKAYPFIDGEVHSYVSDIIDQQRFVNRLITLYDLIMRASAKGVLLFPDECIPVGMDLQDVAEEWSQFNGVIPYRARPGIPMPTQVSANSTNVGIADLLRIEMQMLEDISGVSPTLQGKLMANSTSGTLFAQQNQAAQTSLLDIFCSFTDFLSQVSLKSLVLSLKS